METTNNNFFIFTIGRMNPPTPGHLGLIKNLIEKALEINTDKVFIILSKTFDKTNPLACENQSNPELSYKKELIDPMVRVLKEQMKQTITDPSKKELLDNIRVITICVPDIKGATPFTPLYSVIYGNEAPYNFFANLHAINLFMIIGEDRGDLLDNVKKLFNGKEKIGSVNGQILPREEMSRFSKMGCDQLKDVDISSVPTNAFSASFVRNIVECGLKEKFNDIYKLYLDETTIDKLYVSIQSGMQEQVNVNRKKRKQEKRGGRKSIKKNSSKKTNKTSKKTNKTNKKSAKRKIH